MEVKYIDLQNLTGMGYRTVKNRLEKAKIEPIGKRGMSIFFESKTAIPALYCLRNDDGTLDLQEERAKLAVEQTRQKRRLNDIEEGQVAPVEVITEVLSAVCARIASVLDALPMSLKKKVPSLTARDIDFIKKEIARCRAMAADAAIDTAKGFGGE